MSAAGVRGVSAEALTWAFRQSGGHFYAGTQHEVRPPARFVLVCLADRANHEGACWPGYVDIGYRTGYSTRRVQQLINALVTAGLVERLARTGHRGQQTSNLYVLHMERGTGAAEIGRRIQRASEYNATLPREPMIADACEQLVDNLCTSPETEYGKFHPPPKSDNAQKSAADPALSDESSKTEIPKISPLESKILTNNTTTADPRVDAQPVDNSKESASVPTDTHSPSNDGQEVRQGDQALPTAPPWRHLLDP